MSTQGRYAFIDVETTGVDTRSGDVLLQLAAIVSDKDFNELGTIEVKFHFNRDEVAELKKKTSDYVIAMHENTGLWDQLSSPDNTTYSDFDAVFLEWLKGFAADPKALWFGGNSITLDREFVREFLPKSYDHLSHRSMDMTSVEAFLVDADGRENFTKELAHDALADIRESLAQARYHRIKSSKAA